MGLACLWLFGAINGMRGTLALSWGPWGGFYLCRGRLCIGWLAITYVPVEIDELMEAYVEIDELMEAYTRKEAE